MATFVYDDDGRWLTSTVNGTTTYFAGAHYELTGSTVTKYYFAGASRIAMRKYTIPQSTTLTYLLGDHLGSTSLAVDASTGEVIETRYKPWGEVRYTTPNKTLPTQYTFTGQYSYIADEATDLGSAGFGLLFYNARMYDPAIGRFTSADTIVPGGVQGLDRYAYVNNSPINYVDPSGHDSVCSGANADPECFAPDPWQQPLLIFSTDPNQSFTSEEIQVLEAGAQDTANALAQEMNEECIRMTSAGESEECSLVTPQEAFYDVFGGPISVKRVSYTCGCWAEYRGKNADGQPEIWIFSSTSAQQVVEHPRLIVHEIGHAFYRMAGGFIEGSSVGDRNGFYGFRFSWQFGLVDSPTEIYADMFVGWVYGKWELKRGSTSLSDNGAAKSAYMDKYMPLMIDKAIGR